jgi:hypothetical protein
VHNILNVLNADQLAYTNLALTKFIVLASNKLHISKKILQVKETNYSLKAHKDVILHWISNAMVKWWHENWSLKKQSLQSASWVMHLCSSLTYTHAFMHMTKEIPYYEEWTSWCTNEQTYRFAVNKLIKSFQHQKPITCFLKVWRHESSRAGSNVHGADSSIRKITAFDAYKVFNQWLQNTETSPPLLAWASFGFYNERTLLE